jgi:hypothetical protein
VHSLVKIILRFLNCLCNVNKQNTHLLDRAHPSTCYTTYINAWKTFHKKLHVQSSLPDDEHMMFEIFRRQEELNYNITLKSVHFVGLHYIIISHCTVQKHKVPKLVFAGQAHLINKYKSIKKSCWNAILTSTLTMCKSFLILENWSLVSFSYWLLTAILSTICTPYSTINALLQQYAISQKANFLFARFQLYHLYSYLFFVS